eukprot:scaffold29053_cov32-Cyclotella_meneghiniana.AAC.1
MTLQGEYLLNSLRRQHFFHLYKLDGLHLFTSATAEHKLSVGGRQKSSSLDEMKKSVGQPHWHLALGLFFARHQHRSFQIPDAPASPTESKSTMQIIQFTMVISLHASSNSSCYHGESCSASTRNRSFSQAAEA